MSPDEDQKPLNTSSTELRKIEIEEKKLVLEQEKVQIERYKAKFLLWSVAVPLVAASLAVTFNAWTAQQNMRNQFQLQAAQYLMESEGPVEAWAKRQTFSKMFPNQLPESFGQASNPDDFMNYAPSLKKSKSELFQVLAGRCKSQAEVITLYAKLHPTDASWLNDTFKMKLPEPQTTEEQYK